MLIKTKRRRCRWIEHFKLRAEHLDFACGHVGILGAGLAAAHPSGHAQHVFAAHSIGRLKALLGIRVVNHLHDAGPVAHVQEDDAAVVAAPMHPAGQGHGLADVGAVERPTGVAAHGLRLVRSSGRCRGRCRLGRAAAVAGRLLSRLAVVLGVLAGLAPGRARGGRCGVAAIPAGLILA